MKWSKGKVLKPSSQRGNILMKVTVHASEAMDRE